MLILHPAFGGFGNELVRVFVLGFGFVQVLSTLEDSMSGNCTLT